MEIRPRRDQDLAPCADLVRAVHAADRYPRFLPSDLEKFLVSADAYGAWVAERDSKVVGHVALHPRSLPAALEIASRALGRPVDQLAVVARLFVSPHARGAGVGRRLLATATATAAAAERGLFPVLDVDTELTAAIAVYEGSGWTRAGTVTVRFRDGNTLEEHVYLGPAATRADASPSPLRRAER